MTTAALPAGWTSVALGDIGTWRGGGTPSKARSEFWADGDIPWVSAKDMKTTFIADSQDHITEAGVSGSAAKRVPRDSVLFVTRSGILRNTLPVALTTAEVTVNQDLKVLIPLEGYDPKFVLYACLAEADDIRETCQKAGTTVESIDFAALRRHRIAVPSTLEEQSRIVARIEELLSDVDSGIADSGAAARLVGRCRQAARNHLTLGGISRGVEADGKPLLPDGWRWSSIGDIAELVQYGTGDKAGTSPTAFPVLRMGNVRDGRILPSDLKYMPASWGDGKKYRLEHGDILFNRTNSPELVGKAAVYAGVPEDAVFASYLIRVRLNPSLAVPEFVIHCVNSAFGRGYVASVVSQQVGQANVNGTKLKHFPIPLPPVDEQRRLAERADNLLLALDSIEGDLARSARLARSLRRSILKSAFSGQLV